jgi:putative RNA 2'-phosphotransferase
MNKDLVQTSKFLSLILRHKPQQFGIVLDVNGWANVNDVLDKMHIDIHTLKQVVYTNDKKRFALSEDETQIRASQGHSIKVDLGLVAQQPPDVLYHGTAHVSWHSIAELGLKKMNRQHVHLSLDVQTATKVGQRHGKPFILKVDSTRMFKDGYKFFLSDNGVWLTEHVPKEYLQPV